MQYLRKYVEKQVNLNFLKGKIINSLNIKHNHSNKARFYCAFDEFSDNMVYNQLIKSTLLKLNKISKSHFNRTNIIQLLYHFDLIEESIDFISDFKKANNNNRLFTNYKQAISWSEVFLTNKSFTNFSGNSKNMAILFPMERIFEDYIGHLCKKYAGGREIKTPDKSYYLVEKRISLGKVNEAPKFRLKPDIVSRDSDSALVIDTKWKLLTNSPKDNYGISQSDMYQLYAYGKKYTENNKSPALVLLYPKNKNFTKPLDDFIYDGDLVLRVMPFDLKKSLDRVDEEKEINKVLKEISKPSIGELQENH